MKHQILFSLKNNEKISVNVVCCSRNWRFKGLTYIHVHVHCLPVFRHIICVMDVDQIKENLPALGEEVSILCLRQLNQSEA